MDMGRRRTGPTLMRRMCSSRGASHYRCEKSALTRLGDQTEPGSKQWADDICPAATAPASG
jgi:hypothetical protein